MASRISAQRMAAGRDNPEWPSALERSGFAIVNDVVEPDTIDDLIAAIDELTPQATVLDRGGSVYATRNLLSLVPPCRELAKSAALIELARTVLGPSAFVVRGLLFDKTPTANWGVPWHQDLTIAVKERREAPGFGPWTVKGGVPHVQPPCSVLEGMLTIRVQLDDDSDEDRGPLRVIPGSHTAGKLDAEATREWLQRVSPVSCPVPRGGALLMRPLILHSSSPGQIPARRRVIHLEYAASPLPGQAAWFEESEVPGS